MQLLKQNFLTFIKIGHHHNKQNHKSYKIPQSQHIKLSHQRQEGITTKPRLTNNTKHEITHHQRLTFENNQ